MRFTKLSRIVAATCLALVLPYVASAEFRRVELAVRGMD
jgi:hypothetical protein